MLRAPAQHQHWVGPTSLDPCTCSTSRRYAEQLRRRCRRHCHSQRPLQHYSHSTARSEQHVSAIWGCATLNVFTAQQSRLLQQVSAAISATAAAVALGLLQPCCAQAIDFQPAISASQQSIQFSEQLTQKQVFLDVSVNREPRGRIIIKLYQDAPVGSARFDSLAEGKGGVGYRLSKVDGINEAYIKVAGVRALNYSAVDAVDIPGGDTLDELEAEMEVSGHKHDQEGMVSLTVKDAQPRQVKEKVVAYQGKLVTIKEEVGPQKPNGTGFAITLAAAPQLDATNLVVGEVVDGMDLVREIARLPVIKSNQNSAFFKAAKTFGDRRADVAELGFNRPFAKVVISASGAL